MQLFIYLPACSSAQRLINGKQKQNNKDKQGQNSATCTTRTGTISHKQQLLQQ
jgi:hypothetical protein